MALQMPREIVTSMLPSQANEMAVERKRSADQGAQGAQQQQMQMLQQRLAQNHEADMQTLLMKGQDADRQFQSKLQADRLKAADEAAENEREFSAAQDAKNWERSLEVYKLSDRRMRERDQTDFQIRKWQVQTMAKGVSAMADSADKQYKLQKAFMEMRTGATGMMNSLSAGAAQATEDLRRNPRLQPENMPVDPVEQRAAVTGVIDEHLARVSKKITYQSMKNGDVLRGLDSGDITPQELLQAVSVFGGVRDGLEQATAPEPVLSEPKKLLGPTQRHFTGTTWTQAHPGEPGAAEQEAAIKKAGGWAKYVEQTQKEQRIAAGDVYPSVTADMTLTLRTLLAKARLSKNPEVARTAEMMMNWDSSVPIEQWIMETLGPQISDTYDPTGMAGVTSDSMRDLEAILDRMNGF